MREYRLGQEDITVIMDFEDVSPSEVSSGYFEYQKPNGEVVERLVNVEDNNGAVRLKYTLADCDLPLEMGVHRFVGKLINASTGKVAKSQGVVVFEISDPWAIRS
jgi:hypothetical protein